MTIVKNISAGPRGIFLASGTMLMLDPGKVSDDVELGEGELEGADPTWFLFGKDALSHSQANEQTLELKIDSKEAQEAIAAASAEFERRWNEIVAERDAAIDRAESAEARLDALLAEHEALKAQLAAFDHDDDGKPGGMAATEPATDDQVKAALGLLDPATDEDWTAAGLPAVDAVAALAGGKVTRQQIQALAPDLTRETAKKG